MKYLILILPLFLLACENMNSKKYSRTPHLPVFPEVTPQERSKSNPYWTRFTGYSEDTKIKLSNNEYHEPLNPSLSGALGTHYRWPADIYFYVMTGGTGIQYDYFPWKKGKLSPQLYFGIKGNRGAQISYAHEVSQIFDTPLTLYLALQRQEIFTEIECTTNGKKPCNANLGTNFVEAEQDIMNSLIGLQWGRYQFGDKGYTTVNFRLEVGVHRVLSGRITKEDSPSEYQWKDSSPMISVSTDFTIW